MAEEELGILIRLQEVRTFIAQAEQAIGAIEGMGAAATTAGAEMKGAAAAATEMGVAAERSAAKSVSWSNATGTALTRTSKKLKSMGHEMTSVGLPMVALGAVSVKMAVDFEESMTKVETLVGASGKQVEEWTKQVLALSHETGVAPKELADALYYVTSAGFKGAKAMDVLRLAAQGAELGMGAAKDIANSLTTILKAYAGSGLTASHAMDIFTATLRAGKMAPQELTSALSRVAPMANFLGVSFGELGGVMASMSRITGSAAAASTYMRGVLISLVHPASQSVKALKTIGYTIGAFREEIAKKGLLPSLQDLQSRIAGFSKQKRIDLIGQIFPNQRAMQAYFLLMGKHLKDTQSVIATTEKSGGLTAQAMAEQHKKTADRLKRGMNDLRIAAINLGTAILPMALTLVKVIGSMVHWFDKLSPTTKKWIMGAAVGLVVLGGLAGALSKIINLAKFVLVDMKVLTAAQWLWNAALDANPIAITILALVALGAIFVVLYAKFKWFREGVAAVWGWIKGHWPLLLGILTGPIGLAVEQIITHWDDITSAASTTWDAIKTAFWTAWHWIDVHIIGPMKEAFDVVKDIVTLGGLIGGGGGLTAAQIAKAGLTGSRGAKPGTITITPGHTVKVPKAPKPPGAAAGGIVTAPGLVRVGERGPELLNLPAGAQVEPLPAPAVPGVQAIGQLGALGSGTIVTQVYLDRRQIAEAVGSYTSDKLARR